jgi:hypothetical protein
VNTSKEVFRNRASTDARTGKFCNRCGKSPSITASTGMSLGEMETYKDIQYSEPFPIVLKLRVPLDIL